MSSHGPACGPVRTPPGIAAETWVVVEVKLAETWSPEQISGHLKANGQPTVSHEAIYQRIYADKRAGGTLHRALRCQKVRKKRYGGRDRRGVIPNQVSIDLRPAIAFSTVPGLAIGRPIWLSERGRNRRSSPSTSALPAIR